MIHLSRSWFSARFWVKYLAEKCMASSSMYSPGNSTWEALYRLNIPVTAVVDCPAKQTNSPSFSKFLNTSVKIKMSDEINYKKGDIWIIPFYFLRNLLAETWWPCNLSCLNPIAVSSISWTSEFRAQQIPFSSQWLKFKSQVYHHFYETHKNQWAMRHA